MTFNGSWGWQPTPSEDWHSVRKVLDMLRTATAGGGNLLLNIGPKPDGAVPEEAHERLTAVGKWLEVYGEAVYGAVDRVENMEWMPTGAWTRKGNTLYFWCTRWPGSQLAIGGLRGKLENVRLLPDSTALPFKQDPDRLVISGLPEQCPDRIAGVAVLKMQFAEVPCQILGAGYEPVGLEDKKSISDPALSPFISSWRISLPCPKAGDVSKAKCVRLRHNLGWQTIRESNQPGFANAHALYPASDGIVYFANRLRVKQAGAWTLLLGYDGGVKVFLDGRKIFCDPRLKNPSLPDRSRIPIKLSKGEHEICVAFDLAKSNGWGIFARFGALEKQREAGKKFCFPEVMD